jgi:trimethylamine--corrinoid protein Co-methyltransferase
MSDMLSGVGLLAGSTVWSFAQMIMDCEIFGIIASMMEGIPVNEETLALDAIKEVGPGGTFLTHGHTKRHLRELWMNSAWTAGRFLSGSKRRTAPDWALARAGHSRDSPARSLEPLSNGLRLIIESVKP